ncbi:MAG: GtrA family protein [Planctomycetota bacterium]|jgi:putative flippase GtrA|nr:GtrA family protein [Planctomycetota bacterium]
MSDSANKANKWPKTLPPLTDAQQAVKSEFMAAHLDARQNKWYGVVELKSIRNLLSNPKWNSPGAARALRQAVSGSCSTAADLLAFQSLLWIGVPVLLAALISFCLAFAVNFCGMRHYVHGEVEKQRKNVVAQLVLTFLASLVSLSFIEGMLMLFSLRLGWPPLLVKILALPPVFVWTLFAGRFIIFNK